MFTRYLVLPAAIAGGIPAAAAAQYDRIDYRAVSRCEDAVAERIERSLRLERLAFATDPRVEQVSRSAVEVRGDGFYVRADERVRIEFNYDCRFDDRGYVPVVRIDPPVSERSVRRWERRPWRARVGDAPMPPIERSPFPHRMEEAEPQLPDEAVDAAPPVDGEAITAPPPPEPIEPAASDPVAAEAGQAAAEAVQHEAGDPALAGAVIAAIGESKGSAEPDSEFDRGKQPYEAAEGITCYPEQRACYDSQGFDPRWTESEFGAEDEEALRQEESAG